jgi:hypothetical protein
MEHAATVGGEMTWPEGHLMRTSGNHGDHVLRFLYDGILIRLDDPLY